MVNIALPGLIIGAAAWYPRLRLVPAGAAIAFVSFTLARAAARDWRFWTWAPGFLAGVAHPIVLVACVSASGLAAGAVLLAGVWRRVGVPDEHLRCAACGYLVTGTPSAVCPECGAPWRAHASRAGPPLADEGRASRG